MKMKIVNSIKSKYIKTDLKIVINHLFNELKKHNVNDRSEPFNALIDQKII